MKYQLLNNEPLQFYNQFGDLIGTIEISGSGDMLIRPESGSSRDIILGNRDTVGDIEIGLPSAESTWKFMGGGMISANGNTLTIGDSTSGDTVIFDASVFSGSFSGSFQGDGSALTGLISSSYAVTASHALNAGGGGGGSGIFVQTGSIYATSNDLEVTGSTKMINTASSTVSSNVLSIEGSGSVSGSGIFDIQGSVGQLFEVQDGLDGVLMSVNDISGIPILTVSSSGDVILAEGSTLQGTAATASFVQGVSAAFPFTGSAGLLGSLYITGSGTDILDITGDDGQLFSVNDGLDGVLMSVNDISGLPLFEVSSSGDIYVIDGNSHNLQRPITSSATNFTASADNRGFYFRTGGNITCSIQTSSIAPVGIGAEYDFFQTASAGNFLFESGSSTITVNSKNGNLNLAGQFSSATLKKVGTDEWDLMGDLT